MTRIAGAALWLTLLAHPLHAQAPLLDLHAGHLSFTLGAGDNVKLSLRGVPVIHKSTLYLVHPGWTGKPFLDQDNMTPVVTTATENGAQTGTADYETPEAYARYKYEVRPDDSFHVTLTYGLKVAGPAEVEYDAAYLNANLLSGVPYSADTVDGARSGSVPLVAKDADQVTSRLTSFFKHATFNTALGTLSITATGNTTATSALNLFDARLEPSSWARENPLFWLGIGAPSLPVPPGDNTVEITYTFGVPMPNATIPSAEGTTKLVPLAAAQVPYSPDLPVIPHPKEMTSSAGTIRLDATSRIVIPDDALDEERNAALELQAELRVFWGVKVPILTMTASENALLADTHHAKRRRKQGGVTQPSIGTCLYLGRINTSAIDEQNATHVPVEVEGYYLNTFMGAADATDPVVAGRDARGVYNGVQTLKQLIRVDEKGVYIKAATIRDWPSLSFRGVHWFGGPQSLAFHKQMIDRIVAPLKMNAMVYQVDYANWASQPKIWNPERGTPLADVKKTVTYARAHFIQPIPLINGMGHADWLFGNKQNLDIAADPTDPYAYNPENPESYKRLFAIYDEAINIFHPKIFHIGNDEVTNRGQFPPTGVNKTTTQLIIEDTKRRHDYLASKGIRTMMWGDTLLYKDEANDAALAPTPEDAAARRDALPKDIIIADWHYTGSDPDFKSVPILQKAGYSVVGTSWYNWGNVQNFSRELNADKSMGLLQSTWAGFSMSPEIVKSESAHDFIGYLVAAEYAWNGGQPGLDKLGYSPDDVFAAMWDRKPVDMTKRPGFTVDLSGVSNADMWQWSNPMGAPVLGANGTGFPSGTAGLGGTVFLIKKPVWLAGALNPAGAWPQSMKLPLEGRKASSIHFTWGTNVSTVRDTKVAEVRVTYVDGTSVIVPIQYGHQIFAFDDVRAGPEVTTTYRGTSPVGGAIAMRQWTWTNPNPTRPMANVSIRSENAEAAPVLLGVTGID